MQYLTIFVQNQLWFPSQNEKSQFLWFPWQPEFSKNICLWSDSTLCGNSFRTIYFLFRSFRYKIYPFFQFLHYFGSVAMATEILFFILKGAFLESGSLLLHMVKISSISDIGPKTIVIDHGSLP